MSDQLLQDAQRLHRAGRVPEAWQLYLEILHTDPRNFQAYQALGAICFQIGQYDRSQQFLGEALRLNSLSPDCLCMRGVALLRLQRHREALACFDSALSISPDSVEALSNRALAYLELGCFQDALAAFDAIFIVDPNHAVSWSNRGNV